MQELLTEFWGYLKLYQSRIIPVLIIGIVVFLLIMKHGYMKYKKNLGTILCGVFLSFSVAVVIVMTLYGRTPGNEFAFRFIPFSSYIEVAQNGSVEIMLQIIMNVVMFVPLGAFLPCCFRVFERNRTLFLVALLFSSGIELTQGITKIGMFEVDDIFGNVVGAELGFLIWWIINKLSNLVYKSLLSGLRKP